MNNIKHLLNLNIEIEGLLRVAECRKSEAAETLLLSKTKEFVDLLNSSVSKQDEFKSEPASDTPYSYEDSETVLEIETEIPENKENTDATAAMVPPVFFSEASQQHNKDITENTDNAISPISLTPAEEDNHVITIDEMIHRQSSRDLNKAFSLNDRFRYIREIFDNDANYFDETLSNLDMLSNLDEVYDYLLGDIGLNHEDETVKEFLSIIYNHFNTL